MGECYFYRLSDCVLIKLLSFLDATSLYHLSSTCKYFNQLVKDKQLWRYIDARGAPNHNEKIDFVVNRIHEKSNTLLMRAHSYSIGLVPSNFFKIVAPLDNIRILALENQCFDGESITIKHFPRNLEELSLRKSYISKCRDFFRLSREHVLDLRVLILDDCQWVDCGCLMSISKYKNLEILSLIKCRQLDNDAIAYFGLARLGYKKLRIFDSRFTVLGTPVLSSFSTHISPLAYYFQHERSYAADYGTRSSSAKTVYHCFPDMFDRDLSQFMTIAGKAIAEPMPQSQLYLDPYGECTCNYKEACLEPPLNQIKKDETCKFCKNAQIMVQEPADVDNQTASCSRSCSSMHPVFMSCFSSVINNYEVRGREPPEREPNGSPPQKRRRVENNEDGAGPSRAREERDPPNNPAARHIRVSITQNGARFEELEEQPEEFARFLDPASRRNRPRHQPEEPENLRARVLINVHIQREVIDEQWEDQRNEPEREAAPGRPPPVVDFINFMPVVNNRIFNGNVEIVPANLVAHRQIPLRRLSLRGFRKLTDACLTYLKDLQLDLLDLTYTSCTAEGIRKYLSYNPNCRVVHNDFCRCKPRMPF